MLEWFCKGQPNLPSHPAKPPLPGRIWETSLVRGAPAPLSSLAVELLTGQSQQWETVTMELSSLITEGTMEFRDSKEQWQLLTTQMPVSHGAFWWSEYSDPLESKTVVNWPSNQPTKLGPPRWPSSKKKKKKKKQLPANAGDTGSIPESGRSPWGGNGNLLQFSCLGNPWWATVHGAAEESGTT